VALVWGGDIVVFNQKCERKLLQNPPANLNDMGKRGFNAGVIQIESYVMNSTRSFGRKGWCWPTGVGYDAGWV